jgi:hypothetical protein
MKCSPLFASLSGLLAGLLLAILAIPLNAQPVRASHPGRGFSSGYDAAHEITLNGTVQEVITKHVLGSPAGMHLLIAGPQGTVDAHVGPFLAKDAREALQAGLPVQIVGAMETRHGRQYLLVRQLIFGGRLVTVRSANGFLLPTFAYGRTPSRTRTLKSGPGGGVR